MVTSTNSWSTTAVALKSGAGPPTSVFPHCARTDTAPRRTMFARAAGRTAAMRRADTPAIAELREDAREAAMLRRIRGRIRPHLSRCVRPVLAWGAHVLLGTGEGAGPEPLYYLRSYGWRVIRTLPGYARGRQCT
eukprot:366000-Chlamydomonas_euryale.AAC.41